MLTIKEGLFQQILQPSGVYYAPAGNGIHEKYKVVTSIPQKWRMMIPEEVQNCLGMYEDSALTYIVNGRPSSHHDSTDSNRTRLKESMKGITGKRYEAMERHVHEMIRTNAAILAYKRTHPGMLSEIAKTELQGYMETHPQELQDSFEKVREEIAARMQSHSAEVSKDSRISDALKRYTISCMTEQPETALTILLFLALFDENDKDAEFYTEFETHFLGGTYELNHITKVIPSEAPPAGKEAWDGIPSEATPGQALEFIMRTLMSAGQTNVKYQFSFEIVSGENTFCGQFRHGL